MVFVRYSCCAWDKAFVSKSAFTSNGWYVIETDSFLLDLIPSKMVLDIDVLRSVVKDYILASDVLDPLVISNRDY